MVLTEERIELGLAGEDAAVKMAVVAGVEEETDCAAPVDQGRNWLRASAPGVGWRAVTQLWVVRDGRSCRRAWRRRGQAEMAFGHWRGLVMKPKEWGRIGGGRGKRRSGELQVTLTKVERAEDSMAMALTAGCDSGMGFGRA